MIFSGHANKDGAVENFTNFEPEKMMQMAMVTAAIKTKTAAS